MVLRFWLGHHPCIFVTELFTMTVFRTLVLACSLVCGLCSVTQAGPSPRSVETVDINDAREMDLDGLPGLGPKMTRSILQARHQQAFDDWQDLMRRVPGIKSKTAQKLSAAGLRVRGQSFGDFKASIKPAEEKP